MWPRCKHVSEFEHRSPPLTETTAWTAKNADYLQYLEVDLKETMNVTAIATQGREDSLEYVTAYTLEYGRDGTLYSIVLGFDGSVWVSYNWIVLVEGLL